MSLPQRAEAVAVRLHKGLLGGRSVAGQAPPPVLGGKRVVRKPCLMDTLRLLATAGRAVVQAVTAAAFRLNGGATSGEV
jgi:hypothetical protein